MINLALGYAARGWPVFPLEPKGKQPLGRLVPHGLKDATTDEKLIKKWWKDSPDANIGIPTGVAFDVDDIDTDAAMAAFQGMATAHGTNPHVFPRARTGAGGRHLFMAPTGVGNRTAVITGMDWRGKGGYIVAPGSIHPSGEVYSWILEPNGVLPPCPDWLLELLKPVKSEPPAASPSATPPRAYLEVAIKAETDQVRSAAEGERNDALNRASFALGTMVGAGWLSRAVAEAELRAAALSCGLHQPEVDRTVRSGVVSGMQDPRQPPAGGFGQTAGGEIRPTAKPEEEDDSKAEETPWLVPLGTYLEGPPEVLDWLVEGLLIAGGVGVFGAKPKVAKTTLLTQFTLAVARGVSFLGRQTKAGPVIYLALEEDRGRVIERFRKLGATSADPIHIHVGQAGPEGFIKLSNAVKDLGAILAVVDPIQRLTRLENISDYSEVSNATDPLIAVARQTACAIVFSHHLGKTDRGSGDQLLGSTALFGAVDTAIVIRKREDDKTRTLETIQRYGASLEPMVLGFEEKTGAAWIEGPAEEYEREHDQVVALKFIADQLEPVSQSNIIDGLAMQWGRVLRAINGLLADRHIERRGQGRRGDPYVFRALLRPEQLPTTFLNSNPFSLPPSKETGKETGKERPPFVFENNPHDFPALPTGGRARKSRSQAGLAENVLPLRASQGCPKCGEQRSEETPTGDRRCHKCGEVYSR